MKVKLLFISICIFILIVIYFVILFFTGNLYMKIQSFTSPNNEYKITIKSKGANWPFGEEEIKIYAYENSFKGFFVKTSYKTNIYNDGKNLSEDNFSIKWEKDSAILTLSGEEQENENIIISFNKDITIKLK